MSLMSGCSSAPEPKYVTLMAIDTSGSASAKHKQMFKRATEIIQSAPGDQVLYLYRFDSKPAEVFSETPPSGLEQIAELLNELLKHKSNTEGTNLAALLVSMNSRISQLGETPFEIVILTDCGTERMDKHDEDNAKRIALTWSKRDALRRVAFYGVADGHRERIRALLEQLGSKLDMLR